MSRQNLKSVRNLVACLVRRPAQTARHLRQLPLVLRGERYRLDWCDTAVRADGGAPGEATPAADNPLWAFFRARESGRGIWKWQHYFDIYHRHFARFVGTDVHVVEVGVYSGGSLEMWRQYFGPCCRIFGIDIEEACRAYEGDRISISIGDQENRDFWREFKRRTPRVDILIDDGGHQAEQQTVTMEEMLPHLQPGGVYLCEDVTGEENGYAAFVSGMATGLNGFRRSSSRTGVEPNAFQSSIAGIHSYPFVTVIEKHAQPVCCLPNLRRGSEWRPLA